MARNKKHNFDDKKQICYKLYIEEKRPMRELLKYFETSSELPREELPK